MWRRALPATALSILLAACAGRDRTMTAVEPDPGLERAVELQETFARVAEKVFPSVVCLSAYVRVAAPPAAGRAEDAGSGWREASRADRRYPNMRRLASASGFAIADDGYIITCMQFLRKPDGGLADLVDAETPDGSVSLCRVVGTEPTLNLAVLELEVHPSGRLPHLEPAAVAEHEAIDVGQWALIVGDPLGPERTFAAGIVSARPQRDCYQADLSATFLQASLHVPAEAYGGPLVNVHGEVMGLITPRDAERPDGGSGGLAYALPMHVATGIFESLKVANSFSSPWLGFSVLSMAEHRARMKAQGIAPDPNQPLMGVYIDDVFDPSPASRAGVRVGDILLKVNGQRLISVPHFQTTLYLAGIGNPVTLEIHRNGQTLTREMLVEARPADADAG